METASDYDVLVAAFRGASDEGRRRMREHAEKGLPVLCGPPGRTEWLSKSGRMCPELLAGIPPGAPRDQCRDWPSSYFHDANSEHQNMNKGTGDTGNEEGSCDLYRNALSRCDEPTVRRAMIEAGEGL